MAVTIALAPSGSSTPENPFVAGPFRVAFVRITGDSSYVTNGSSLDTPAQAVGINNVIYVEPQMAEGGTNEAVWDSVNRKLKVFVSSTGAERSQASDAANVYPAIIWGT